MQIKETNKVANKKQPNGFFVFNDKLQSEELSIILSFMILKNQIGELPYNVHHSIGSDKQNKKTKCNFFLQF